MAHDQYSTNCQNGGLFFWGGRMVAGREVGVDPLATLGHGRRMGRTSIARGHPTIRRRCPQTRCTVAYTYAPSIAPCVTTEIRATDWSPRLLADTRSLDQEQGAVAYGSGQESIPGPTGFRP